MLNIPKTQKKLKEYTRKIVNEIGFCLSIKSEYPQYWDFFLYLFARHSDYPDKFNGLCDIMIQYNHVFRNQLEVCIRKENGDTDDVSVFNNCITGKSKNILNIAMRNAILPQILDYKYNNKLICVICLSNKNPHVDHHVPQFIDLMHDFIEKYWHGEIPNTFKQNRSHSKIFIKHDKQFENEWYNYHKKNATLRILCRKCNCSRPRSCRLKREKLNLNKLPFNSKRLMNCKNEEPNYKLISVKDQYMRIWYEDIGICEANFPCEYSNAILYTGKKEWILLKSATKYRIKIEGCLKNVWIGKVILRDEALKLTNEITPSLTETGNIEDVYMIYARCKASMRLLDPHMRDWVNNFPFEKNDIVSIKAVAGSGKTTTLLKLAQENSDKKILYLAFNKALANEVRLKRNKMAKNLEPYTFDAFIRKCFIDKFPNKGFPIKFLTTYTFGEEYPWFQRKPARMKKTFITKFNEFCKDIKYNEIHEFMNEMHPTASSFTKKHLIKMWIHAKQNKLMTFDGLRKLAFVQHWFKDYLDAKYDMIFIDEAQDFDPVMLEILLKDSTIPKVFVGDPRQAIYEWRGAINAFKKLPDYTNTIEFYTTWRIGEPACDKIRCKFTDCWMIAGNKNETLLHQDKEPNDKYDYLFRSWRYLLQTAATKQNVWINDYYKKIEFIKRLHKKLQKYPLSEEEKVEFEDDLPNFLLSLSSYELEKLIADIEENSVPKKLAMCCMYTIHSYKGMENNNIRVFNDIDHEEEKNIYYVALTRGIKNIYLDYPPEDAYENKKQSVVANTMMPANFRWVSSKKKRCWKKGKEVC